MKESAIYFYRQGYNCSACILKAAEKHFDKTIPKQSYWMCQGINTGFGIGGMCSVLIAAIMVFGFLFDNETVKRLRIKLFNEFKETYPNMNCSELLKERRSGEKCETVVGFIAELTEKLIKEEKK